MEPVIVWYLRMSVIYFVAGVAVGLGMLLWPSEAGYYLPVHVHLNLLGFMSMMIYGVGYHILPKFSGRHIYSPQIVKVQFWLANAGLIGMAISWPFHVRGDIPIVYTALILSSVISCIAIFLFAINIVKTVKSI
jgi:cytochrome c oxidase cbb3-type subunit 1